jgi:hypothetical protein
MHGRETNTVAKAHRFGQQFFPHPMSPAAIVKNKPAKMGFTRRQIFAIYRH